MIFYHLSQVVFCYGLVLVDYLRNILHIEYIMINFFTQSKTINIWNFWLLNLIYIILLSTVFFVITSSGWTILLYFLMVIPYFFLPILIGTLVYFIFCQVKKQSKIIVNMGVLYSSIAFQAIILMLNKGDCGDGSMENTNFIQRLITGQSCWSGEPLTIQPWLPLSFVYGLFALQLFIYFIFIVYSCVSVWRKDKLVAKS